ncbi:MAG: hypothetical protein KatS3mg111_4077 [Pirellulaceae bacterium]|nr:MAG: hypothetical protein KatS3mg111_4077 [Pirellulaceae bacterium]
MSCKHHFWQASVVGTAIFCMALLGQAQEPGQVGEDNQAQLGTGPDGHGTKGYGDEGYGAKGYGAEGYGAGYGFGDYGGSGMGLAPGVAAYGGEGYGGAGYGGYGMGGYGALPDMGSGRHRVRRFPPPKATPAWMNFAAAENQSQEEAWAVLFEEVSLNLGAKGLTLQQVLQNLSESAGVGITVNKQELDMLGVDPEMPIDGASIPRMRLYQALRWLLDPLDLTYRVHSWGIEITSVEGAEADPTVIDYDLGLVLEDSSDFASLYEVIQQTCESDSWLRNGGVNTMVLFRTQLVVAAPDDVQLKIQSLLAKLARHRHATPSDRDQASRSTIGLGAGARGGFVVGGGSN